MMYPPTKAQVAAMNMEARYECARSTCKEGFHESRDLTWSEQAESYLCEQCFLFSHGRYPQPDEYRLSDILETVEAFA